MRTGGTTLAPEAPLSSRGGGKERLLALRSMYQKGQLLFSAYHILLAVAGFLLGRATLLGEVAPFGAVFWLLALREKPVQSFLVAAAVLAGRASAFGLSPAVHLFTAMAAVWLVEGLCLRATGRRCPLLLSVAILIGLSRLPVILHQPYSLETVFAGLELAVGSLAAVVMLPGLDLLGRLPRSRDRPGLAQEEIIAVFLMFILALVGVKGVYAGNLSVEVALNVLCLLLIAYLMGVGWGAAMGIITGTILGLGDPRIYLMIGSLSFSGFWAGLLRAFGRWGCAAGFLFSLPVLYLLAPGELPGIYWREGLLSLVVFLAIPSRCLEKLSLQLRRLGLGGEEEAEEKTRWLIAGRIRHFANLFNELSLGFAQTTAGMQVFDEDELYPLLEDLMNRVCRSCLFRRRCWEKDLYSHHRLMLDLLARAEVEGAVEEAHLPPSFRERCHQPHALIKAINNLHEIWQVNRFWENKVREGKELVSEQLQGLAGVMRDLAGEVERNRFPPVVGEQAPLYNLELGLAQKAGRGNQVCGDSYSLMELGSSVQAIILSDGMGNGPRAAAESKTTINMLERLLEAGFHKDVVLRTANALLQLRTREETFATVDMALIDLAEGEVELLKIGAAPAFLKRGEEVFTIGASSLPMGILCSVEAECFREKLYPADLLVLVTDGVADPDGDTSWLGSYLRRLGNSPPQIIADRIVEETARRSGGNLRDDVTVSVCRLVRLSRNR